MLSIFLIVRILQDSLSGVEVLLRKHEAFEKALWAQMSKIEELEKFGMDILATQHYDSVGITQRLQAVTARRDRLKESAAARRRRLHESRQLHQFLRNMYEVSSLWKQCIVRECFRCFKRMKIFSVIFIVMYEKTN